MLPDKRITSDSRLGFIGLGHLGSRIAQRLATAGFPMVVYDRDRTKTEEIAALGAKVARNPGILAGEVDVVLSCLTDGPAVEDIYLREGKVLEAARSGTTVIEFSTIAPETSQEIHRAGQSYGITVLDVAVSGSTPAAEAGTLTLFGGGERETFEAVEPILSAIASQWFYMGPSGNGVAMKLVVNTLLGLGMQAIAEAVALGTKLGLPRDSLFDTLAKTAVVAPAHAGKLTTAKQHNYSAQFPVSLMRKDFGLILDAAAQLGLVMPATEAAAAINYVEAASGRDEDFSAVIRQMELGDGMENFLHAATRE